MEKKIIWVINQTAGKPNSGWGERHYYLSNYWIKKGYDIKIISGSYNHLFINQPKVSKNIFTVEKLIEGISFCWVKIPKYDGGSVFKLWSMVVFAFRILFLKKKYIGKPDIIIVSSMPLFQIISGIYLKWKFNSQKLFFEIRDLWPLTPMCLSGYSKYNPIIIVMKWIEKVGYKKSDKIVSLLPNADKYINKISKNPSKFHWIPNGIDESLLINQDLPLSISLNIPKDKFIIGYTGSMGMANALEYLIETSIKLKKNNEIHFVLVGDGYLKEDFKELTKLNNNITFINKIRKDQIQSILKLFDICYVGRYNNKLYDNGVSYNKYFDYMLASKPILESSNRINSPAELAGCAKVVLPESAKSIIDGINEFKRMSTDELESIGKKGYGYVKKNHNFEYLSNKYLELF